MSPPATERLLMFVRIFKDGMTIKECADIVKAEEEDFKVFFIETQGSRILVDVRDPYYFNRNVKYGDFTLYRGES